MHFHSGPVLSLAVTANGEQCFSGGIDSTIQWWNIPSANIDPYDTYGEDMYLILFPCSYVSYFSPFLSYNILYGYLFMFHFKANSFAVCIKNCLW